MTLAATLIDIIYLAPENTWVCCFGPNNPLTQTAGFTEFFHK